MIHPSNPSEPTIARLSHLVSRFCHLSRMPDLLHLAIAQLKPRKGDYAANLDRLAGLFAQVAALDPRPRVLHLAESALTGYFLEGGVREVALTAGTLARDLGRAWHASGATGSMDVVIGFYDRWRDTLYNSAMYARVGDGDASVLHVHRKNFLPTYGLFDEERFFEPGHDVRAFDTPLGLAR